jgi:uncharacterized protein (DUF362 family)
MMTSNREPIVSIVHSPEAPEASRIGAMMNEALELLGGVSSYVSRGDTVVIKINLFAPFPPPVSGDRRAVAALVELCRAAGAERVVVAEAVSYGTRVGRKRTTRDCFELLGVKKAVQAAGGEILCLEDDERVPMELLDGFCLHRIDYPRSLLDADVLINMPCLKTHSMTMVTLGIKNFQGILTDEKKYESHRDDLSQHVVDIHRVRLPDLTVVDGLLAMEGNGAGESGIPVPMNLLLAGPDMVAVDAVAAACMGISDVLDVQTIRLAQYAGLGVADLDRIEVRGAPIDEVRRDFELPITFTKPLDRWAVGVYPNIDTYIGGACSMCWLLTVSLNNLLGRFAPQRFTVIAGVDPKIPPSLKTDLDHTIIFGDCPAAATGSVKELRNAMLLQDRGVVAAGCPPYRPAMAAVENHLIELGILRPEEARERYEANVERIFGHYRRVDPTWEPGEP